MSVAEDVQAGQHFVSEAVPKVSVVIPLYHAEDYIDDLLQQLRTQVLNDIEIICIIDGPSDGTADIVKRHAALDARVHWLWQEHAGAGAARNAGIAVARGEYLAFFDADDLYDSQFLVKMYETASAYSADLVVCRLTLIDYKTGKVLPQRGYREDRVPTHKVLSPQDLADPFADFYTGPINRLYRRAMVEQKGLRFSHTMVANDVSFVFSSVAASERIVALPDNLITVRSFISPLSISSNRALHTEDMFTSFQDLYDWLSQHELFEQYREYYLGAWADGFHYNATYQRNDRFIELAAKTLATDGPWCSMSDRKLWRTVRLDTSVISIKKFFAARQTGNQGRDLELQRLDNDVAATLAVVQLLNSQYGRHIPTHPHVLGAIIAHLRRTGLRHSVARALSRLVQR